MTEPFTLTEPEWALLSGMPTLDIVAMATDLDIVVPESCDKRELLEMAIPRIIERGRAHGLPFSKYDAEDLQQLSTEELAALGTIQGVQPSAAAILRAGQRVYKAIERDRGGVDPVAMMLPSVLRPMLRHAIARGLHHADP